jgi:RimJ/RimL family protein N-acetyltransferase
METFTTPRLVAEKLNEAHLADLVALHLDPHVSRYLGGVRSAEVTRAYLSDNLAHWDRHGFGLWVLKMPSGEFVGRAGIRHLVVDGASEVEVAYTFARPFWGRGFATEITGILVDLGLVELGLPSLVGVASVDNAASRRVLEKTDFLFERQTVYQDEEVVVYRRMNRPPLRAKGTVI